MYQALVIYVISSLKGLLVPKEGQTRNRGVVTRGESAMLYEGLGSREERRINSVLAGVWGGGSEMMWSRQCLG